MRLLATLPLLLLPATVAAEDSAQLQGEPAAIAKYRHAAFSGMGKHMRVLGMYAKGQVVLPKADIVAHAKALQSTGPLMANWFPDGTGPAAGVSTDALDTIWKDKAGFKTAIDNYKAATDKLVNKAEAGEKEAIVTAFKGVGKTCGGCHDTFRKDDD